MKQLLGLILLVCVGCGPKYSPTLVTLAQDHKNVTVETNTALISSISDDMETEMDVEVRAALSDLKERLEIISAQSKAMYTFMMQEMTEEELAEVAAAVWRNNR